MAVDLGLFTFSTRTTTAAGLSENGRDGTAKNEQLLTALDTLRGISVDSVAERVTHRLAFDCCGAVEEAWKW